MKVCGSGSIASTALHSSVLGFSTKYFLFSTLARRAVKKNYFVYSTVH